jgi:hypothetical protein
MIKQAYKLFNIRKDGSIGPLFINKKYRIPMNKWIEAESHPTPGYAYRPGWHCTHLPAAPHLKMLENRRWYSVEIQDYTSFTRPEHQGGEWFIAQRMRVISPVDN